MSWVEPRGEQRMGELHFVRTLHKKCGEMFLLCRNNGQRLDFCSDDDPEKLPKVDDGSSVDASAETQPAVPQVPITTPPPVVGGGDAAAAQAGYAGYSSWYQVWAQILMQTVKSTRRHFFLSSSFH